MRNRIGMFWSMNPVGAPGAAAVAYVPWVMVSRGLAFLRTLLVARLLGEAGKEAFGLYQPALELVNPLVALALFGAADVAERYVSQVERLQGPAGLRRWIAIRWRRLAIVAVIIAAVMLLAGNWLSLAVWGSPQLRLLAACAATVIGLALYQHLAATLRGLRAYAAAAGLEITSACLLLLFSAAAALTRSAAWLMCAYALSIFLPLLAYRFLLHRHLTRHDPAAQPHPSPPFPPGEIIPSAPSLENPGLNRFAAWALVRLLLVMLVGFFSIWGVRVLAGHAPGPHPDSPIEAGQYAMPYRIAQLLGFVAVTLWASTYGIAARAWSHGHVRRAKVQMFRIARHGMALLLLLAAIVLWSRGLLEWFLPAYAAAIDSLLPPMLAMFIAYGMVAFLSSYADLRESPQRGAAMWGIAAGIQAAGILAAWLIHPQIDPKAYILLLTTAGLAAGLLIVGPIILWPIRFSATGVPPAIMGLAALSLLVPGWVVDWIAGPVLLGTVGFLWLTGLLVRPIDRRAFRRWKNRGAETCGAGFQPARNTPS